MRPMPAAWVSGRRVLVIVPAWNEQASIGTTVSEIRACVPEADLLVERGIRRVVVVCAPLHLYRTRYFFSRLFEPHGRNGHRAQPSP